MKVKIVKLDYTHDGKEDLQNLVDQDWTPVAITMYDPTNCSTFLVLLTRSQHEEI